MTGRLRSKGWIELAELYDDGGFFGGTLERPALQRLLADTESRRVDVLAIYRINLLSRSLMDDRESEPALSTLKRDRQSTRHSSIQVPSPVRVQAKTSTQLRPNSLYES